MSRIVDNKTSYLKLKMFRLLLCMLDIVKTSLKHQLKHPEQRNRINVTPPVVRRPSTVLLKQLLL